MSGYCSVAAESQHNAKVLMIYMEHIERLGSMSESDRIQVVETAIKSADCESVAYIKLADLVDAITQVVP